MLREYYIMIISGLFVLINGYCMKLLLELLFFNRVHNRTLVYLIICVIVHIYIVDYLFNNKFVT